MVSRFPLKVREKTGTDDGQHVFHTIKTALSSSFMVMVMDPSGNVIEVNDKFVQLFQYNSTELQTFGF
ncbi:PAS domain-containing protein [Sporosarcina sp. FSL W7-1349]|uniref:PAS domain-containing protein n=1 Tax=Sporosarcina sp. FSL W7-1349 TaxID=2921561 RepID=UPI0030FBE417